MGLWSGKCRLPPMMLPAYLLGVLACVAPALGQLSARDIDALRKRGEEEGWTFTVGENPATRRPWSELCGVLGGEGAWPPPRNQPCEPERGLPRAFDWRDFNGCSPIRNQGSCGSCWAFAGFGVMESNILIRDHVFVVDLAEQWLISCTSAGDCGGGGVPSVYRALLPETDPDVVLDECGDSGAVLEQYFPYVADDVPCECPYPHSYWIESWSYIVPQGHTPTREQIKQTIIDHGPVSIMYSMSRALQAYTGGGFNYRGDGKRTHVVVFVGWDDDYDNGQGLRGAWIMRNSWGTGWGEEGYGWMMYDVYNGNPAYVVYGVPDCNGNGIADSDDIASGYSEDCNGNGRPDECDVAYGMSPDGNNNGIPDDCEACEVARLLASDGHSLAKFGHSVAIDGDVAVVGAWWNNENGPHAGAAYIFRYDGSSWIEETKLTPEDGAAEDRFGCAVAISGDVVAIGAYMDDGNVEDSGSAYVFRHDGVSWVEEARLLASDGAATDRFGESIGISDNVVIIGADLDDDHGSDSGSAYIYRWNGVAWSQEAKLTATDGAAGDWFGCAVAVSGDRAIVGARNDDDMGNASGSAYMYHDSSLAWQQEAKLVVFDGAAFDCFGYSVALSGDVAAIGSYKDDDNGEDSGSCYIFRGGFSSWEYEAKLLASDGVDGDAFGYSVGIDGNLAVVGAYWDDEAGDRSGSAYVFRLDGLTWIQDAKPVASDAAAGDAFGSAVAISRGNAIIGTPGHFGRGHVGAAYLFGGLYKDDCNENGANDACDIRDGTSADCNANFVPDECDIDSGFSQDMNCNGVPDECECIGDLNGDGVVDDDDRVILLAAWGLCPDPLCPEDLNCDGVVGAADLLILLGAWGPCP